LIFFFNLGKNVNGFIRKISLEQDFGMILHSQQQVDVIKCVASKHRILRVDATGNLVNVPKYKRNYPKMLSYFMQLKYLRDIDDNRSCSVILSEMHTSRHDTYQIKDFISLFKSDFEKDSKKRLNFRLVCSDYSFTEMHAVVQALNTESINDYCERVYNYCIHKRDLKRIEKSWLISCVSHTMHRFSRGVSNLFTKDKVKSSG
jgi:hypothetical protein